MIQRYGRFDVKALWRYVISYYVYFRWYFVALLDIFLKMFSSFF